MLFAVELDAVSSDFAVQEVEVLTGCGFKKRPIAPFLGITSSKNFPST